MERTLPIAMHKEPDAHETDQRIPSVRWRGADHDLPSHIRTLPDESTATQNDFEGQETESRSSLLPGSISLGANHLAEACVWLGELTARVPLLGGCACDTPQAVNTRLDTVSTMQTRNVFKRKNICQLFTLQKGAFSACSAARDVMREVLGLTISAAPLVAPSVCQVTTHSVSPCVAPREPRSKGTALISLFNEDVNKTTVDGHHVRSIEAQSVLPLRARRSANLRTRADGRALVSGPRFLFRNGGRRLASGRSHRGRIG